jgi:DNA-binding NtrC family response regulator
MEVFEVESTKRKQGSLLVIDNNKDIREITKAILSECGYNVLTAQNGVEGLKLFKEKYLDIKGVLLDMVMPDKSGIDIFIEMKEIYPDVKVVFCSSFKLDDRVQSAMDMGVKGFIDKPFNFHRLAEQLSKYLEL